MKTIGVLGGLGPQATMEFEQHVHRVAQKLVAPNGNSGYPPMVVLYFREPPVVVDGTRRPQLPIRPNPKLLEAAARLGRTADFLVVTSNGVHTMQAELERAADRPILSMVELVLADVERRGWRSVGALSLFGVPIYSAPLAQRGFKVETIPAELQHPLDAAIMAVSEGRNGDTEAAHGRRAVEELRSRGTDGILLGCTEIPLLLGQNRYAPDLVDPLWSIRWNCLPKPPCATRSLHNVREAAFVLAFSYPFLHVFSQPAATLAHLSGRRTPRCRAVLDRCTAFRPAR